MSDEEVITVADVSPGPGGVDPDDDRAGDAVEVPVVELLTGRGFLTGKSGGGKSNTASVIVEKLLDGNFPVMIVDTDGEYYGLKEEYEILHAGADEECDIQVVPEHAEKLASLALEQNVPLILDVSGYLDDAVAEELLLETTRHLFAKEKKLKKPFLLLVEECHEYIPEGGGLDELGRMLIKVGKRGRKHGLGIVGISQRPADVKKDYITQCDWLCWHRLTWDNDTTVVGRILGNDYADAIEDLADGEAFLMTDWTEEIQRVQFHRKQTFDAGATPGLEDFERPELKSVSGDLVSELESISDERERHESELADLRQELDKKRQRISELERELEDARDLSQMADTFAQAMLQKAEASYRGGDGTTPAQRQRELREYERTQNGQDRTASDEEQLANEQETDTTGSDGVASNDLTGSETPDSEADGSRQSAETLTDGATEDLADLGAMSFVAENITVGTRGAVVRELRERIERLDPLPREMLEHYRREGASEPIDAHIAAGGDANRNLAYSRNRQIRQTGLIRHAGQGTYTYAVPDLVRNAYDDRLDDETLTAMCDEIERALPDGTGTTGESGTVDPESTDRSDAADDRRADADD